MSSEKRKSSPYITITSNGFNQDASSVTICQKTSLDIWSISSNCLEVENIYSDQSLKDVIIAERLFSSSLLVIIARKEPRTLRVYHFRKGTEICAYSYGSNILSVKINRLRLVVICEKAVYFHDTKDMQLLHEIKDITFNPKGICCLSKTEHHPLFAYSGSSRDGIIHIYECSSFRMMTTISAHKTPVAAIAIHDCNSNSANNLPNIPENVRTSPVSLCYKVPNSRAMIATASDTGTVVRVWAVRTSGIVEKVADLRRGTIRSAKISSLNFSEDGKWLALISDTETVHIWRVDQLLDPVTPRHSISDYGGGEKSLNLTATSNSNWSLSGASDTSSTKSWFSTSSWTEMGKDLAKQVLPTSISCSVSAERAQITATLPSSGFRAKVAIFNDPSLDYLQILVSMPNGGLLVYEANCEGGEARYIRRLNLYEEENSEDDNNTSNTVDNLGNEED